MIRSLEIAVDLGAQEAVGERVLRVAGDARRSAALDGRECRACVRAIVRTGSTHDTGIALRESRCAHGRARSRTGSGLFEKGTLWAPGGPRWNSVHLIRSTALSYRRPCGLERARLRQANVESRESAAR